MTAKSAQCNVFQTLHSRPGKVAAQHPATMPQTAPPATAAAQPPRWYDIQPRAAAQAAADEPARKAASIYVYGNIGDRWNEDGVVAAELVRELAELQVDEIDLRINSYGGSVTDGMAILNALQRHAATVTAYIDGVALSCASYIAMGADKIVMAANAQMMIHAPWGVAYGNAEQLREQAEILDRYARSMATAYARKSGMEDADALALLTDGQDHWYSAEEAVAAGLADEVGDEIAVAAALASSFDLTRFRHAPAPAPAAQAAATAFPQPRAPQGAVTPPAAAGTNLEHPMPELAPTAANPAAPVARTREQNQAVLAMFKPFVGTPAVAALKDEVLADPALSIEQIQAKLLATIGDAAQPANPQGAHPRVETLQDEADKRREAVVASIRVRAGVETDANIRANIRANPFRGMRLMDLARNSLDRAGIKTAGMSQMEIVAAAFTQGTSDFPVLLETAMHKSLQAGYGRAPMTWNLWCRQGSVSDFRTHNRYRVGSFGDLDAVTELGEYVNKTIPDGEKASISVDTKGNVINLSRKAIINDDLGAFIGLAGALGQAAARTVENAAYDLLKLNSGLGPTQSDTHPLFHSNRSNVNATGSTLTTAGIDADASVMAQQKDVSGNDFLDLRPAVLLVPRGLEGTARVVNGAEFDPDANNKLQRPNIVRGLFSTIVGTPRLTGTRRYLFADPNLAPVFEVAFLDGQTDPYMEMEDGFDVDGARWKVRLDYGVAAVDFRGAVTNAGT